MTVFLFCKEFWTMIFKSTFWKRMYLITVKSHKSQCMLLLWSMLRNSGKTKKLSNFLSYWTVQTAEKMDTSYRSMSQSEIFGLNVFSSLLKYKHAPRNKWCIISIISHANIFYFSWSMALVIFITLVRRTKLDMKDIEQKHMANSASVSSIKAVSNNIDQQVSIIPGSQAP